MKYLIYSIAFLTLLASLTSCTADEIQETNNTTISQTNTNPTYGKDGDIIPPIQLPIPH